MSAKRYIHITNWDRYQHPDTRRSDRTPMPWIKDFTSQINDIGYRNLTYAERGLLHSMREMYALNRGDGIDIAQGSLHSLLGQRVTNVQLERLNDAGFIEFSASKTLAPRLQPASLDLDLDVDAPKSPPDGGDSRPSRAKGTNPRAKAKRDKVYRAAEAFVRNAGAQYTDTSYHEEITRFDLTDEQRHELDQLRIELLDRATAARSPNGNRHHEPEPVPIDLILDTEPEPEPD